MLNYDSYTFLLIFIVSINICYSLDTRAASLRSAATSTRHVNLTRLKYGKAKC